MTARVPRLLAWAFIPWTCACAVSAPTAGSPAPSDREVAALHTRKCGACHAPPEPKSRTRAELEGASVRHKNRVRLTPSEWARLIDYLAKTPGNSADASALTQPLSFR